MIHSVKDYLSGEYDHGIADVNSISTDSPAKHRMLASLYSKRFKKHLGAGERDKAERDLISLRNSAQHYYDLDGKTSALANVIMAILHMREAQFIAEESERNSKYLEAISYLNEAKKLDRAASYIDYDLASCYSRIGKLREAIEELRLAKEKGDLRKKKQLEFFDQDEAFEALRKSSDPQIQQDLAKLKQA
jgi:tetratricopeptide (TPR) repeat protein